MKSTGTTRARTPSTGRRASTSTGCAARASRGSRRELERSDMGALLAFDFTNIRYMTATHIGTWAIDKLIRFSLLTRNSDPISWDFGSAAKHHALYNPWLDVTTAEMDADPERPARERASSAARARRPRRNLDAARGLHARCRDRRGRGAQDQARAREVRPRRPAARRRRDRAADPLRPAAGGHPRWSTDSRCSWRPAASRPATRSGCSRRPPRWWTPPTRSCTGSSARACERTRRSDSSPRRSTTSARSTSRASTPSRASAARRTRTSSATASSDRGIPRSSTSCTVQRLPHLLLPHVRGRLGELRAAGRLHPGARVHGPRDRARPPRRHDGRYRVGVAHRPGVRVPRRRGGVRAAVRPRRRALDLGEADLLSARLARSPRGPRGGHGLRARDLLAVVPTAGAPRASRRRSW